MRSKTIKIPIYQCKLTIILTSTEDLKEVQEKYNTPCLDDFGAVTLQNKAKYRHYVVAFTEKDHLSNIVHEIVHIKNYIFLDCAMEVDKYNDEPEAYLSGWLFKKIYKFLHKK